MVYADELSCTKSHTFYAQVYNEHYRIVKYVPYIVDVHSLISKESFDMSLCSVGLVTMETWLVYVPYPKVVVDYRETRRKKVLRFCV